MPPTRYERIYTYDKIYVFGTDEHIEPFRRFVISEGPPIANMEVEKEDVRLQKLVVSPTSPLCNKSIKEAGIREMTNGPVAGIEREGRKIMNPDSNLIFAEGDILWIVGTPWRIKRLEDTGTIAVFTGAYADHLNTSV